MLDLCELRLQDDGRFPWVVLSPRRVGAVELADLAYAEQCQLLVEIDLAGRLVRTLGQTWSRPVQKLNIANLGNVTPQLHWHIVGRRSDDPCWPGPVWGQGTPEPLGREAVETFSLVRKCSRVRARILEPGFDLEDLIVSMATASNLVQVMIVATRKAGRRLARDFGEVAELQVSKKGPADFVSAADLKAEQTLVEELSRVRPGYGFLAEERGAVEGTDKSHRWIIDPLDGTTNFLHAIPHFCISVALEREGELVAGVIYNPAANEIFWAEKGKGAFLNNEKRLRVAARRHLDESILATGVPFLGKPGHGQFLKEMHQLTQRVAGIRRFGSAALDLAYVAAGRFDGYWERDLAPWDIAAGALIVVEAGGKVTTAEGDRYASEAPSVLVANADLHPLVLERLKAA
eukprot:gene11900-13445_t